MPVSSVQPGEVRFPSEPILMPTPPKPVELLKLQGTYRKDRHGERDGLAQPEGHVQQPSNLDSPGLRMWAVISEKVAPCGFLTAADQPIVDLCCRLWGLLQQAMACAQSDPMDKDARASVVAYTSQWMACAGKLGLSPADRVKLAPATAKKKDDGDEFFGATG